LPDFVVTAVIFMLPMERFAAISRHMR